LRHIIRVPYPYFYSSCIPRQANGYGRAPPNFAPPLTAMRGAFGNQKERIIGPADSPNVTDVALKAASPATFEPHAHAKAARVKFMIARMIFSIDELRKQEREPRRYMW
jgi:hypothetical protein